MRENDTRPGPLSVVIPVLGEAERIDALVAGLLAEPDVEVVVVDGAPDGSTLAALEHRAGEARVTRLVSQPGRAAQMNAGATQARGAVLLFLHADTALPAGWSKLVRTALRSGFARCGAFSLAFADGGVMGAVAGRWATLRSRLDRRPYGDQAPFFAREFFHELGGYADLALMEDVEIMRRATRAGWPPAILPHRAATSARRYREQGWLRRGLGNLLLRARWELGADPARLARAYHPRHAPRKQEKRIP